MKTTPHSRRNFLSKAGLLGLAYPFLGSLKNWMGSQDNPVANNFSRTNKPIVISTWDAGVSANVDAWKILSAGGSALDAVEAAARVAEADPLNQSVGYGGLPDRDGFVTLDACIMDHLGNAGSVTCLQHIMHPISVARKVMEDTPHVMLTGEGALQFALQKGFKKQDLLTPTARAAWEKWKAKSEYKPVINIENHDTIGILALDEQGHLGGACTTSGLAFKMHGRVGDSPIIGAGLFVDQEVGAAVATGLGEFVMKTLGSFLVVEFMRRGYAPQKAVEEAIDRITSRYKQYKDFQIAYLALNTRGQVGAYAIQHGFSYARCDQAGASLLQSDSFVS